MAAPAARLPTTPGACAATEHSPADDLVHDLVSEQYHALTAAKAYDSYVADAEGHEDVQAFWRECAQQDAQRRACHALLSS